MGTGNAYLVFLFPLTGFESAWRFFIFVILCVMALHLQENNSSYLWRYVLQQDVSFKWQAIETGMSGIKAPTSALSGMKMSPRHSINRCDIIPDHHIQGRLTWTYWHTHERYIVLSNDVEDYSWHSITSEAAHQLCICG